jgi:capsular exopolysaccharide synthesis family protein
VRPLALKLKLSQQITARKKNLLYYFNPESVIAEQYRIIRANINFSCNSQMIRTLLITSPSDGEGKSTTSANLAVSMAQQNERVLLIDANLRNPSVHSTFKVDNINGFTSVLNGIAPLDDAIYKTEIGRLDVLPSGPITTFPSEILASERLEELFAKALETYDYVLLDSPSILEVADTKILANKCDGVIIVLNPGKTKLKETIEAKKILEFANSQIAGVILNEK